METYLSIAFLALVFFIFILSQFGARLIARHALIWWAIFIFVIVATLKASALSHFAALLGVKVVSNLVFGGLILLLMFLLIELTAELTKTNRTLREMITNGACERFLMVHQGVHMKEGKKALIVLPCYNEEASVEKICLQLKPLADVPDVSIDFCFVNDGSTDLTEELLRNFASGHFVSHEVNMGVSAALLTGFKIGIKMNYDYVVQCDSDGQHPVSQIPQLIDFTIKNNVDLLIGSRFTRGGGACESFELLDRDRGTTLPRRVGIFLITKVLKLFRLRTRITDPTSGFRVYSKEAVTCLMRAMPDEYPEPESIAILALKRKKIEEVPISMQWRMLGSSSLNGLRGLFYMAKVISSLIGLRLRLVFARG